MISVVDYGVANLGSMLNMLRKVGAAAELVGTPEALVRATKIVLPGIGAFDHGMAALAERGLVEPLRHMALEERVPLLGICLGMQLLDPAARRASRAGLGWIQGDVVRFRLPEDSRLRVPHMGWSTIDAGATEPAARRIPRRGASSTSCTPTTPSATPSEAARAHAQYGLGFVAAVEQGSIRGVQFHPEKSHRYGMAAAPQLRASL